MLQKNNPKTYFEVNITLSLHAQLPTELKMKALQERETYYFIYKTKEHKNKKETWK